MLPRRRLFVALALAAACAAGVWVQTRSVAGWPAAARASWREEEAHPAFLTQDSYYFFRQAREGLGGDRPEVAGVAWDDRSFAPAGRPAAGGLLAAAIAAVARWTPLTLGAAAIWVPVALAAGLPLLAFGLAVREAGGKQQSRVGRAEPGRGAGEGAGQGVAPGVVAGLAAALLLAVHPEVVAHVQAGIVDTTGMNLGLLVAVAWLSLALDTRLAARRWRGALGAAVGIAAVLAVFRAAWGGWVAGAALAGGIIGLRAAVALVRGARRLGLLGTFLGVLGLLAAATGTLAALAATPVVRRLSAYLELPWKPSHEAPFPTVLGQIAELAPLSPEALAGRAGGPVFLALALLGLGLTLRRGRWPAAAALGGWTLAAAVAGTAAQRFAVYAVPPLAVLAGIGVGGLLAAARGQAVRAVAAGLAAAAAAAVAGTAIGWSPRLEAAAARRPAAGPALSAAASAVGRATAPAAIVDVWWDRGHAWTALSGRRVALDGATHGTPRTWWLARALATDVEAEALHRLWAIDCGIEDELFALFGPTMGARPAMRLLTRAFQAPDPDGVYHRLVEAGQPRELAAQVRRLFACAPPRAFLVVSDDLAGKTKSWADLAAAPVGGPPPPRRPPAITGELDCRFDGTTLACANGLRVRPAALGMAPASTGLPFPARGTVRPDGLVPIVYDRGDGALRLVHVEERIAESLLVRLFYLGGEGLTRFEPFTAALDPATGERVLVYEILWPGRRRAG